jgi:hypothetical protein
MMEAIMEALAAVGSDGAGKDGVVGYMKMIAEKNPRALLPPDWSGDDASGG